MIIFAEYSWLFCLDGKYAFFCSSSNNKRTLFLSVHCCTKQQTCLASTILLTTRMLLTSTVISETSPVVGGLTLGKRFVGGFLFFSYNYFIGFSLSFLFADHNSHDHFFSVSLFSQITETIVLID